MRKGGFKRRSWSADAIIIRRADVERVHDYARRNCCLRDYLLIRLPMKIGLRTGEICTLKVEYIDFVDRSFRVFDSKRKALSSFPLPLDLVTLQLIRDLIGDRVEGYVFIQRRSWKRLKQGQPLTVQEVWHIVRKIGLAAGVEGFKPRVLREYFAAVWAHVEKKSLVTLQWILRHKSLETTQVYVNKLVFWEDVKSEYEGVKAKPFKETLPLRESLCSSCLHRDVCRFAPLPSHVTGCRFYVKKEGVAKVDFKKF